MARRLLRAVSLLLSLAGICSAHEAVSTTLTWNREISRIVAAHCSGCHAGDGIPLMKYKDARPWAKAIRDEVLSRRMPPWGAVKGFGQFKNDPSLTQEEISLIAQWVEGGAPEGDPYYLPPSPPKKRYEPTAGPSQQIIKTRFVLQTAILLKGLRPMCDAASARLTATRSDGSIEPLLWLHNFQVKWHQTFQLLTPLRLEAGTVLDVSSVGGSPPVEIALVTGVARPQPRRRTYSPHRSAGVVSRRGAFPVSGR